ncbi:MAG: hypothetical protein P1V97_35050 [Planctomycetota bacterium]|nr:hypothetical protein [Planctomycetota bacterium]
MTKSKKAPETDFFWTLAKEFLSQDGVTEGSLMGFPCLRVNGEFFGTCDHRSGDLIVKLPKDRVAKLIADEKGHPFAPAGRIFKEWVLVKKRNKKTWTALLKEGQAFVQK